MPQRFAQGNSSAVLSQQTTKRAKVSSAVQKTAASIFSRTPVAPRPAIENLEPREMLSTSYLYVATWGSDNNAGSLAAPFKTIQRAANVATAGTHVEIESGTYHEMVTVPHSGTASAPIVFEAYNNESVTISGADPLTNWSAYSSTISKTPMSTDLGVGNNEVFVDGRALVQAQYPNTSLDLSHPSTLTIQSVSGSTIYNSALTQATNYWKGAVIHIDPGQAWVDETGVVTSSKPGSITISYKINDSYSVASKGNQFYLLGKLQQLTSPGTWYRDPTSGELYVWTPSGDSASYHDVEVKTRQYAFDLNSAKYVTIQGVNIFAAGIETSSSSTGVVINKIGAQYVSQFEVVANGWWVSPIYGIMLMGSNDVLENSTVAYSSGDGVVVKGAGSVVTNNVIHDVDFVGADDAAVRVLTGSVTISHNTIYNAGRDGIFAAEPHMTITYNTIHDVGLQTTEPGGIYTVSMNGQGSVMAYNDVYNVHTAGWGGTGLFLDNNTSNWSVYDNVTSNVDYGLKLNYNATNDKVYNNTLGATDNSISTNNTGYWGSGTKIYNNTLLVSPDSRIYQRGASVTNNLTVHTATVGAAAFASGASNVAVVTTPPVTTPVTTPPVTTPPVTTPPVTTPPVTTPTTGTSTVTSATTLVKAVSYTDHYGVTGDGYGGVGGAYNNYWVAYKLDFGTGVAKLTANIAAMSAGGKIEVHIGSATGTLAGTITVAVTGAWNKYTAQSTNVTGLSGVQTVYLVFKGSGAIANVSSLQFSTTAVSTPTTTTTPLATSLIKAANYTSESGLQGDTYGGIGYSANNDWAAYTLNFGTGVSKITAALASIYKGPATIEVHIGSATGALAGTLTIGDSGAWNKYVSTTASVTGLKGVLTVYLVFKGAGANGLGNISTLQFA